MRWMSYGSSSCAPGSGRWLKRVVVTSPRCGGHPSLSPAEPRPIQVIHAPSMAGEQGSPSPPELTHRAPPSNPLSRPQARYLHTAVVLGDSLYVYGGNKDGAGDVAVLDLRTRRWAQLVDEAAGIAAGPGPRLGHTAAAFESSAMRCAPGFMLHPNTFKHS